MQSWFDAQLDQKTKQALRVYCPNIYTVPKSGLTSFKIKATDIMPPEFKSGL